MILAFHILLYLEDTKKVMRRINELLKPGGLFISATFCMVEKKTFRSILLSFLVFFLIKIGILPYMRLFKVSEIEDSIIIENFKIIETKILNNSPTNYFIAAKKI